MELLIAAAALRVRRLISSALKLSISRGYEEEVVRKSLFLCPIGANKGARAREATKRASTSPTADFQPIRITKSYNGYSLPSDIKKF